MVCGKLEIDILNSFWNLEASRGCRAARVSAATGYPFNAEYDEADISIQDIVDDLARQGIVRAYTTIKTVMDRLAAKSVLVRYKSGKKFFYKAAMSKAEMANDAVSTLVEQFFEGDHAKLMRFVESEWMIKN
jgi:predicted transcriptional regulator